MKKPFLILTAVFPILTATAASAALYTTGHGDLGIAYDAGAFDLHVHLHSGAVVDGVALAADDEYAPGDLHVYVPNPSVNRPANAAFAPIGVAAGQPFWFLPATQDPAKPFFGVGAEELTASEWTGNIQLRLMAISGSGVNAGGQVSLWNTGTFGELNFLWSSVDGLTAADTLGVIPGSHAHYNIAFTKPGFYDLTVQATGTNTVDGLVTSSATYQFAVVNIPTPVPEPTTGLWGLVAFGFAATSRLRRPATV